MTQGGPDRRFAGAVVPEPEFGDDDGSAPAPLVDLLAAYADGTASVRDVAVVLAGVRLMTPLVAVLDEAEEDPDGLRREKSSHMASVSLVSPDGRRGLLAFSSVASMAAWDPTARGIPAAGPRVAAAALEEGADALLLDVGGPVRFALEGPLLRALATGAPLPQPWADPSVHATVSAAVTGLPGLEGLVLEEPPPGEEPPPDLLVLVTPAAGTDAGRLARAVAEALVADPAVAAACPRGIAVGLAGPAA